ncbi:MAG: triose-phosphate isomerase [Candidatus Bipolaricaulota bacterium]
MQAMIAGNWKMNLTPDEAEAYVRRFAPRVAKASAEVVLFPAFPSLDRVGRALADTAISLGAQDLCSEPRGAFTGAVSAEMLVACGCRYVLVGHSERRHVFGESDELVRRKLEAAGRAGLSPVLCIGETLEQRRRGETVAVLNAQLQAALAGLDLATLRRVVIAYEPVWAIGTGETATQEQAQEAAAAVRETTRRAHGDGIASALRILYGGSVKPENAGVLLAQPDLHGALVGGASLDPEGFAAIVLAGAA